MIKISTLFKKNPDNLALVINEVDPKNQWVLDGEGIATRKFDGTAAAIINGELYKRYDVKKGRQVPSGAIPCQEPDAITGHWPHWVKIDESNQEDKYFIEAFEFYDSVFDEMPREDGTYELCGPKINSNRERLDRHQLIKHGREEIWLHDTFKLPDPFLAIKAVLEKLDIEGIVFHHPDGRMCKIRKSDFGIKRV